MQWLGSDIIVENCVFDNTTNSIQNIQGITFHNCEMINARVGIQLSAGVICTLDNCTTSDCFLAGVFLVGVGPHCNILNSTISGDQAALAAYDEATLFSSNTEFFGGSDSVLFLFNSGPIEIHNSHIIPSGPLAVNCSQPEGLGLVVHDLTGNYWGTTDPDLVATWIWDQNDDPANFSIVNYLPMANGPVPTEEKSFGSIKAMFR